MGRLILYVVGALVAVFIVMMIISLVIGAVKFLFWVALAGLLIVGALRLTATMRKHARH